MIVTGFVTESKLRQFLNELFSETWVKAAIDLVILAPDKPSPAMKSLIRKAVPEGKRVTYLRGNPLVGLNVWLISSLASEYNQIFIFKSLRLLLSFAHISALAAGKLILFCRWKKIWSEHRRTKHTRCLCSATSTRTMRTKIRRLFCRPLQPSDSARHWRYLCRSSTQKARCATTIFLNYT